MPDERRTSERIRFAVEVELDGLLRARLLDLSPEGAFVQSRTAFAPGAVVQLRFRVFALDVEVAAEVRHCWPGVGMGVKFLSLDPLVRAEVARLLAGSDHHSDVPPSRRWPRIGEKVEAVCPQCEWHRATVATAGNASDMLVQLRCGACPTLWAVPVTALVPFDENPSSSWRLG